MLARYYKSLSSQIDDISHFQQPASPMQIYTIMHEPPHPPLPNHVQPPPLLIPINKGTAPACAPSPQLKRIFAHQPTHGRALFF